MKHAHGLRQKFGLSQVHVDTCRSGGTNLPENFKCDLRLRRARRSDLLILQRWDEQPHVMAATGADAEDDDWNWDAELCRDVSWRDLLIGEVDGRPVGIVQIIDPDEEETQYWGEIGAGFRAIDIWIGEADDLGCGYGTQMMRLAADRCFGDHAVSAILVDPLVNNTRAHRFYSRLGFRRIERRMFGEDDCFVYRLERRVWGQWKQDQQA